MTGEVTPEMIAAGLERYAEGGCMGLDESERREVVHSIIAAALAASPPALAEAEPVAPLPPIEVDPDMPSREYIPLPNGWEIQTKGVGSSYRLLDRKTGERHSILCNDARFVHDFVTRMAKEIHAAASALYTAEALSAAVAQARREALEEALRAIGKWHRDREPNPAAMSDGLAREIMDRYHQRGVVVQEIQHVIRALCDAAPAEEGWRPIETAPKDGTPIILYSIPNEVPSLNPLICSGYWQRVPSGLMSPGYWRVHHAVGPSFEATHWRPLPAPPAGGRDGE